MQSRFMNMSTGSTATFPAAAPFRNLPKAAYDYIKYIENAVGVPVTYVSVGADREAIIKMQG